MKESAGYPPAQTASKTGTKQISTAVDSLVDHASWAKDAGWTLTVWMDGATMAPVRSPVALTATGTAAKLGWTAEGSVFPAIVSTMSLTLPRKASTVAVNVPPAAAATASLTWMSPTLTAAGYALHALMAKPVRLMMTASVAGALEGSVSHQPVLMVAGAQVKMMLTAGESVVHVIVSTEKWTPENPG